MKNPRVTDEYDVRDCLKGVAMLSIDSSSHLHDYFHYLTFKKEFKEYDAEFGKTLYRTCIGTDFCKSVEDPIVRHACNTYDLLLNFRTAFFAENAFFRTEILYDEIANREFLRFEPKDRGYAPDGLTYEEAVIAYGKFLKQLIKSLYYSCCAITISSYQIPHQMKTNIYYTARSDFRFLNTTNYDVANIIKLISALQRRVVSLKLLLSDMEI
jgi:hypothetical protein